MYVQTIPTTDCSLYRDFTFKNYPKTIQDFLKQKILNFKQNPKVPNTGMKMEHLQKREQDFNFI